MARTTDADSVNGLLEQLGYPQDGREKTAARIQTWANNPASAAYVAEAKGQIVGLVAVHVYPFFEREGASARITALVVSDRVRGQKIGSQLVASAESFAARQGCVRVEVTSSNHREAAHSFYQSNGYTNQAPNSSLFRRDLPPDG
jgi:GNAT superfamily N-acetyltransferase